MATTTTDQSGNDTGENTGTTNTITDQTVSHVDDKPTLTSATAVIEPKSFPPSAATNTISNESQHHQSSPTDIAALNNIDSFQSPPTDAAAVEEAVDSSSPGANFTSVDQSQDLQLSPTSTIAAPKSVDFLLPATNIPDIDELTCFTPSPLLNTGHSDEPNDHQPLTNNSPTVDEPISPLSPSTKSETADETKKSQSPPTNITYTASDEPLQFHAIPSKPPRTADPTMRTRFDDVVATDKPTNLKSQAATISSTTGSNQRSSLVAFLRQSIKDYLFLGIVFVISLLKLIIGWHYADDCPIYWRIPHYLVIAGSVGIALVATAILLNFVTFYTQSKLTNNKGLIGTCGACIVTGAHAVLFIFSVIWFIAGCIWVFGVWNKVQYENQSESNYCHPILYRFAYWMLLLKIFYSVVVLYRLYTAISYLKKTREGGGRIPVPTTEP